VLQLLEKYPTSQRIAAARLGSLEKVPFIPEGMAEKLQNAAKTSVGTLDGDVAEALITERVSEMRHSLRQARRSCAAKVTISFVVSSGNVPSVPQQPMAGTRQFELSICVA